jgi:uncharacterized membrane protein YphA (DoxX/SURF4 family)
MNTAIMATKPTPKTTLTFYNVNAAALMLRIGLAGVFIYAAVSAFKTPAAWISYIPSFGTKFVSAKVSLDMVSVIQLLVAGLLLVGKYIKYAAIVSILLLAGIVIFNFNTLLITFRDVGLIFMALALLFLDK